MRCRVSIPDVPGTRSWNGLDRSERIDWWVRRVGPRDTQLRLLGAVLCDRELHTDELHRSTAPPGPRTATESTPSALVTKLCELARIIRAGTAELARRPDPKRIFHYFGMLPGLSAIADYFVEFGALRRAAVQGEAWIAEHAPA